MTVQLIALLTQGVQTVERERTSRCAKMQIRCNLVAVERTI